MKTLEAKLGYHFQNPALLEHALTHSSYANEHHLGSISSNERLEFLGDSVLGMIVADYLYRTFPSLPEGDLTVFAPTWSVKTAWYWWRKPWIWAVT